MKIVKIDRKRAAIFLSVVVLAVTGIFVANSDGQKHETITKRKVLGKAQIIVYKKGEKILVDPDAPYFKELQLACEEMLVPLGPRSVTLDGFLKFLHPSEMHLPDAGELRNKGFAINIVYEEEVITSITAGFGPAAAPASQISLSEFIVPLSEELTQIKIQWDQKEYLCTYLYLISDFYQKQFVTTRDVKKIKNILSEYMLVS